MTSCLGLWDIHACKSHMDFVPCVLVGRRQLFQSQRKKKEKEKPTLIVSGLTEYYGKRRAGLCIQTDPALNSYLWVIAIQLLNFSEPRLPFGPGEV